jgi:ParB-like chromosome segregation protein Spo0J
VPTETRRLADIVVGDRFRKSLGDLATLAESIREVGLLHPPAVSPANRLIAGRRRLAAVESLGWSEVPVTVITTADTLVKAIKAERDENRCREPMSPADMLAIGKEIERLEKEEAAKRKAAGRPPKGKTPGTVPGDIGDARDKVGEALGISGKHWEDIKLADELTKAGGEVTADLAAKLAEPFAKVKPIIREAKARLATDCPQKQPTPKPEAAKPKPAEPEKPAAGRRRGVGTIIANEAIDCLMRIPIDDSLRDRAFEMVIDWIRVNHNRRPK